MKKQLIISVLGLLFLTTNSLLAQKDQNAGIINSYLVGLEYEVKAGLSIGGTSYLGTYARFASGNQRYENRCPRKELQHGDHRRCR